MRNLYNIDLGQTGDSDIIPEGYQLYNVSIEERYGSLLDSDGKYLLDSSSYNLTVPRTGDV